MQNSSRHPFPTKVIYDTKEVELIPLGARAILNQLQSHLLTTYGAPHNVTSILELPEDATKPIIWGESTHAGAYMPVKGKLGVTSPDRRKELEVCANTLPLLFRYLYSGEMVTLPNSVEFAGRKWYIVEEAIKRLKIRNRDTLGKLYGFKAYNDIRVVNRCVVYGESGYPVDNNSHIIDTWAIANYKNLQDVESDLILAKLAE